MSETINPLTGLPSGQDINPLTGKTLKGPRKSTTTSMTGSYSMPGDYSDFTKYGVVPSPYTDMYEARAEAQPWYEQTINGITKSAITFGGALIGGPVGYVYGLGDWALSGFQDFDKSVSGDNPIYNTVNNINRWAQENLPNYYTQKEQYASEARDADSLYADMLTGDAPITPENEEFVDKYEDAKVRGVFTPNFLFDKLLNGAAYSLASAAQMYLTKGKGPIGLGATAASRSLRGTSVGNFGSKMSKKMMGWQVAKSIKAGKTQMGALRESVATANKLKSAFTTLEATAAMSMAEASVEALEHGDGVTQQALDNYKKAKAAQIDQINAGNPMYTPVNWKDVELSAQEIQTAILAGEQVKGATFWANMAILMPTNFVQFGMMLSPYKFKNAAARRQVWDPATKQYVDKIDKFVPERFRKAAKASRYAAPYVKGAISEAFQEGMQGAVGEALSEYEIRKLNDSGAAELAQGMLETGWFKSFGDLIDARADLKDSVIDMATFKKGEMNEQMLIGAIVGILSRGKSGYKQVKQTNEHSEFMQAVLNTPEMFNLAVKAEGSAAAQATLQKMLEAEERGDRAAYERYQAELMTDSVLMHMQLGSMDFYYERLEDLKSLPEEEVKEVLGLDESFNFSETFTKEDMINRVIDHAKRTEKGADLIENMFPDEEPMFPDMFRKKARREEDEQKNKDNRTYKNALIRKYALLGTMDKDINTVLRRLEAFDKNQEIGVRALREELQRFKRQTFADVELEENEKGEKSEKLKITNEKNPVKKVKLSDILERYAKRAELDPVDSDAFEEELKVLAQLLTDRNTTALALDNLLKSPKERDLYVSRINAEERLEKQKLDDKQFLDLVEKPMFPAEIEEHMENLTKGGITPSEIAKKKIRKTLAEKRKILADLENKYNGMNLSEVKALNTSEDELTRKFTESYISTRTQEDPILTPEQMAEQAKKREKMRIVEEKRLAEEEEKRKKAAEKEEAQRRAAENGKNITDLVKGKTKQTPETFPPGEVKLPYEQTGLKGELYTYYATTTTKDGVTTTTFTFNRSDKPANQRNPAAVPLDVALGDKFTIDPESIPEGNEVTGIRTIRISQDPSSPGTGASADVRFEVSDVFGANTYDGSVILIPTAPSTPKTSNKVLPDDGRTDGDMFTHHDGDGEFSLDDDGNVVIINGAPEESGINAERTVGGVPVIASNYREILSDPELNKGSKVEVIVIEDDWWKVNKTRFFGAAEVENIPVYIKYNDTIIGALRAGNTSVRQAAYEAYLKEPGSGVVAEVSEKLANFQMNARKNGVPFNSKITDVFGNTPIAVVAYSPDAAGKMLKFGNTFDLSEDDIEDIKNTVLIRDESLKNLPYGKVVALFKNPNGNWTFSVLETAKLTVEEQEEAIKLLINSEDQNSYDELWELVGLNKEPNEAVQTASENSFITVNESLTNAGERIIQVKAPQNIDPENKGMVLTITTDLAKQLYDLNSKGEKVNTELAEKVLQDDNARKLLLKRPITAEEAAAAKEKDKEKEAPLTLKFEDYAIADILEGKKTMELRTYKVTSGIYNIGGKLFKLTTRPEKMYVNKVAPSLGWTGAAEFVVKVGAYQGRILPHIGKFLEGRTQMYVVDISPISGTSTTKNVEEGKMVGIGQEAFSTAEQIADALDQVIPAIKEEISKKRRQVNLGALQTERDYLRKIANEETTAEMEGTGFQGVLTTDVVKVGGSVFRDINLNISLPIGEEIRRTPVEAIVPNNDNPVVPSESTDNMPTRIESKKTEERDEDRPEGATISTGEIDDEQKKLIAKVLGIDLQEDAGPDLNLDLADELKANSSFIKLDESQEFYVNTRTGKRYTRVTSFIKEKPESSALLQSASIIGTKLDTLIRDYFANELKEYSYYELSNTEQIDNLLSKLNTIKNTFEKRNETVLANDIVLYDDITGLAGTVDLLTIDANGDVRIYDIKTMRGNNFAESYSGDSKNKYESTKYGKSKARQYQEQLSLYRILLNNTHGVTAKTLGVMPIEVAYNEGDTKTSVLNLLKGVQVTPLDSVKGINGETALLVDTSSKTKEEAAEIKPVVNRAPIIETENTEGDVSDDYDNGFFNSENSNEALRRAEAGDADVYAAEQAAYDNEGDYFDEQEAEIAQELDKALTKIETEAYKSTKELAGLLAAVRNLLDLLPNGKTYDKYKLRYDESAPFNLVESKKSYKALNEQEAKAWLRKRGIPVEFYAAAKQIGSATAHGYMKNAMAYLWKNAEVGTEYHEAFHYVFRIMLNDAQRAAIYEEAGEKYDITSKDITNAKRGQGRMSEDEAYNLALEEKLAEEFKNYVLTAKGTEMSLGQKVKKFFTDLWNYYMAVFRGNPNIDQLFSMIESNNMPASFSRNIQRFKPDTAYQLVDSPLTKDMLHYRQVIDTLSHQFQFNVDRMEDMSEGEMTAAVGNLLGTGESRGELARYFLNAAFSNKEGKKIQDSYLIAIENILSKDDLSYIERLQLLKRLVIESKGEINVLVGENNETLPKAARMLSKKERGVNAMIQLEIYMNWYDKVDPRLGNVERAGWRNAVIEDLEKYGYKINPYDDILQADTENDVEDGNYNKDEEVNADKIYNITHFENNPSNRVSAEVRKLFGRMIKDKPNKLGFNTYADIDETYKAAVHATVGLESWEDMVAAITNQSEFFEELKPIARYINPSTSDKANKKIRTVNAQEAAQMRSLFSLDLANHKFLLTEFEETGVSVKIIDSNRKSRAIAYSSMWATESLSGRVEREAAIYKKEEDGTLSVNNNVIDGKTRFEHIQESINLYESVKELDDVEQKTKLQAKAISDALWYMSMGFGPTKSISQNRVETYYSKATPSEQSAMFGNVVHLLQKVSKIERTPSEKIQVTPKTGVDSTFFDTEGSTIKKFAEKASMFALPTALAFVSGRGKTIYPYNTGSHFSHLMKELEKGKDSELYQKMLEDGSISGVDGEFESLMYTLMTNGQFEIETFTLDTIKDEEQDNNEDYSEITERSSIILRLNTYLNSGNDFAYYPVSTQQDRGRIDFVKLPKRTSKKSSRAAGLKYKTPNELIQEVIVRDLVRISKNSSLVENMNLGMHLSIFKNEEIADKTSPEYAKAADIILDLAENADNAIKNRNSTQYKEFWDTIDKLANRYLTTTFEKHVQEFSETLENFKIIQFDENDNVKIEKTRLDVDGIKKIAGLNRAGMQKVLKAYVMDDLLARIEIATVLRNGAVQSKSIEDYFKRMGLVNTPGTRLMIAGEFENDPSYGFLDKVNQGVISPVSINDPFHDAIASRLEKTALKMGASKEEAAKIRDVYKINNKNADRTDGIGFISPAMHRAIEMGLGTWDMKKDEEIYQDYLAGGKWNYKYTPNRKFYYENLKLVDGQLRPEMDKNSYILLTREFVEGNAFLEDMYERMTATGKYAGLGEVHVINTKSAKKGWTSAVLNAPLEGEARFQTLEVIQQEGSKFLMPQIINPSNKSTTRMNRQIRKNAISNINPKGRYQLQGRDVSGQELLDYYNENLEKILVEENKTLLKRLGYTAMKADPNNIEKRIAFLKNIRDVILSNSQKNNALDSNMQKQLQLVEDVDKMLVDFKMPIEFPAYQRKYQNLIFSLFKNNVHRIDVPGKELVQIPSPGKFKIEKLDYERLQIEMDAFLTPADISRFSESIQQSMAETLEKIGGDIGAISILRGLYDTKSRKRVAKTFSYVTERDVHAIANYYGVPNRETDKEAFEIWRENKKQLLEDAYEFRELRYIDVDEGNGVLKHAEVMVSEDLLEKLGLKVGETGIAYRIPHQGYSSTIPIKIVGLLPKSYSKTIMVPGNITIQTGSDFDIDKLFVMLRDKKSGTKGAEYRNNILDVLEAITLSEENFLDTIKPLTQDTLDELAGRDYLEKKAVFTFDHPLTESRIESNYKAAATLVGAYANGLAGFSVAVHAQPYNGESEEKGMRINPSKQFTIAKDGEENIQLDKIQRISKMTGRIASAGMTERLSAALDVGKKLIHLSINDNKHTVNSAIFLGSIGMDEEHIVHLMAQPLVREFVFQLNTTGLKDYEVLKNMNVSKSDIQALRNNSNDAPIPLKLSEMVNIIKEDDVTSEEAISYFNAFLAAHFAGKELANVYRSITSDTADGMGDVAQVETYIQSLDQVFRNKNNSLVPFEQIKGILRGNDYKLSKVFLDNIISSQEVSGELFLGPTQSVRLFKKKFLDLTGKTMITEKEHRLLDRMLFYYMITKAGSPLESLLNKREVEVLLANPDTSIYSRIQELIKKVPSLNNNYFVSHIAPGKSNNKDTNRVFGLDIDTTEKMTPETKEKMIRGFHNLIYNASIYTDDTTLQAKIEAMGKALIQNALVTTGLAPTYGAYYDSIPIDFFFDLTTEDGISFPRWFSQEVKKARSNPEYFLEAMFPMLQNLGTRSISNVPVVPRLNKELFMVNNALDPTQFIPKDMSNFRGNVPLFATARIKKSKIDKVRLYMWNGEVYEMVHTMGISGSLIEMNLREPDGSITETSIWAASGKSRLVNAQTGKNKFEAVELSTRKGITSPVNISNYLSNMDVMKFSEMLDEEDNGLFDRMCKLK